MSKDLTLADMVNARVDEELAGYDGVYDALKALEVQERLDKSTRFCYNCNGTGEMFGGFACDTCLGLREDQEKIMDSELLPIALAFAKLEIVELQAGKRTLTECPGLENIAKYIEEAKKRGEKG